MIDNTQESKAKKQSLSQPEAKVKKHLKLSEINYRRNKESDYTEKIAELDRNFDYSRDRDCYWSEPEFSILYGTPLYQAASRSQKIALNHLFWAGGYNLTAASETNTVLYNQITGSVFYSISDYETLCHTLDVESSQERYHIHAFRNIGNTTEINLLGEVLFGNPLTGNESQVIQKGLVGRLSPGPLRQLFGLNWGSTPFLASQYYALRFIANMLLKLTEHPRSQYFKKLEKKGEFIPAPAAVAHYHFLDESFHTTTSQLIAQDLYKDFPKPTAYEKFMANLSIYMMQLTILNGLSAGAVASFSPDKLFVMPLVYKILQTPLFGMSAQEALYWIEKCFCHEHEGLHLNLKYHDRLLSDLCKFFDKLDYTWPINREMRVMADGASINKTIQSNTKFFHKFSRSIFYKSR
ncbi:hypothetical protein I8752_11880 [Nostocaceae cyanobacterium CENA369]|uniref:Uncharacterized protein n=1 Tax=Dendronalium phyllosphericum CENA369 TaxID=1725256 RepID=A0A8J7I0G7_9NOST|nr:hypothetical protein [Dendronalium phyllosphericum]MBH8573705.1 hypothetical protein [Dendronalium phyllosphericum CENA369]